MLRRESRACVLGPTREDDARTSIERPDETASYETTVRQEFEGGLRSMAKADDGTRAEVGAQTQG